MPVARTDLGSAELGLGKIPLLGEAEIPEDE